MKTAHAFVDRVKDREAKQHVQMESDKSLNEAIKQAARSDKSPYENTAAISRAPQKWKTGVLAAHQRRDCRQTPEEEVDLHPGKVKQRS
jgi:hypothetical protein